MRRIRKDLGMDKVDELLGNNGDNVVFEQLRVLIGLKPNTAAPFADGHLV